MLHLSSFCAATLLVAARLGQRSWSRQAAGAGSASGSLLAIGRLCYLGGFLGSFKQNLGRRALYDFLEYEKDAEELEEKRQTFRKDASTIVQKLALFQPSPT